MERRKRRGIRRIGKNGIILCALTCFVIVGTVFCMAANGMENRIGVAAARHFVSVESKRAQVMRNFTQKVVNRWRKDAFSVRPGRATGTTEPKDGEKVVYLTFDDGPSENTKKVLDILEQYNAKATFFITGANEECRPYIREAYNAGHTIGLHTYTHNYSEVYASEKAYFEDLERVGKVAQEQIGYVPRFIRFPGGSSNMVSAKYNKGIMTKLVGEVQKRGYQYYDWNLDSGDGAGHGVEAIRSDSMTDRMNHVMILFHDMQTKDATVEALPAVLKYYQDLGYKFKAIDTAGYVCHHSVKN